MADQQQRLQNFVDGVMSDPELVAAGAVAAGSALVAKTQAFFDNLRDSVRVPSCGDAHRAFVTALLLQAETAGLYSPPPRETL